MVFPRHIVAVAAMISNADADILLVQSPRRGWEFPGGQVEEGETLMQALEREIREEAGISVSIVQLVGVYSNIQQPSKVMLDFTGTWVSGGLATSAESLRTEWVPRSKALERISHPAIRHRLEIMLMFAGRVVSCAYTTNPYRIIDERFL